MSAPQEPIKVMRIIARLNVGGPALHCTELSRQLVEHGFDTTLVTGSPESDEASYDQLFGVTAKGYRLVRLGALRRAPTGVGDLKTLFELVRLMKKEKPSIVHTHTAKAGVLGRIAATISGVPVVVHTFHGHVLSGYFNPLFSKLITSVERTLARGTTAIVTLSPALRTELSGRFKVAPENRFRVIPLGRDLKPFLENTHSREELRTELGIKDPRAQLIGTVGRLVPIKDQTSLLEAFARVRVPNPVHLMIAGEGQLGEELRTRARELGVADRVHFLGWRSDLARIYAGLDLFVLSSRNEGTPLSIIEAFAAGCPVVSTAVGGIPDMFGKVLEVLPSKVELRAQGALMPAGDAPALAAALEHLLARPELLREQSQAARAIAQNYTTENLGARMAELYRELLKEGAKSA